MSSAPAAAPPRPQREAAIAAIKKNAALAKKSECDARKDGEVRAWGGGARSTCKQRAPRLSARTTATATPTRPPHR